MTSEKRGRYRISGNLQIGKKFIPNPTSDRALISKIYKELKKLTSKKKTKQPNRKKWGIQLNREFITEESQMTEKHLNVQSPY